MEALEESMRKIFNESQSVHKHVVCVRQLSKLQMKSNSVQFLSNFYEELIRNMKFTLNCEPRSPFTNNSIDFIIKYLLTFSPSNGENYYSPENKCDITLIDTVLNDLIKVYLYNVKVECRINACHFIRKLFDELEDTNEDIYISLKDGLLQRCADKCGSVRASAFLALHRFQDLNAQNDVAITAIQFHLKNDPDSEVRHNCLKAMAPSKNTLSDFIYATRDVKDFIRKTAFIQIAEKVQIKCFTIEQRLVILKNGLKDRSPIVRKVVETVLIPTWVKTCNNDLIELLIALDIQTDLDLIEQMLVVYFTQLNREDVSKDSSKTKFQALVDDFRDKYLNEDRIFKVALNVENVFLWRFMCDFCKNNQIENETIKTSESHESQEQTQTPEVEEQLAENNDLNEIKEHSSVDLVDMLVPDVPYYCAYLEKFINNVISQEFDLEDAMEFEFVYTQFMKISLLFDIGDEPQRNRLKTTMRVILINNQIGDKFHSYISPVMKCLAKSCFTDKSDYLDFTVEIISEIHASIFSSNDENDSIPEDDRIDKLMVELNKYKENHNKCISKKRFEDAESIKGIINGLELQIDQLKDKTFSQSSQSSQKSVPSFSDFPKQLLRCLHIFSGCLEFGNFNEVNAVMQTHIEKVCLLGFLNEDLNLRLVATKCLGLVCLISTQYFKKYLHLLIEVFLKDLEAIKLVALKSIFDSLCEHGINIFEDKSDDQNKKDNNEDNKDTEMERSAFEDNDEDFITSLKQFFDTQLDSESDEIKYIAAQGVAKLLILCKMYSSQLLSKLIIIWYDPNEKSALLQFIGDFLRIYAFAESQGVIVGQSALEEAFVVTLETVYHNSLKHINLDNLIKFFLSLINEESHAKLAILLANKIIGCDSSQEKFAEEYLLPALSQLKFIELESKDMKNFEDIMKKIEDMFNNSKIANKKIAIIKDKIENRNQQLLADDAFADDFAPIDANEESNVEQNEDQNEDQNESFANEKQYNKREMSPSNANLLKRQKVDDVLSLELIESHSQNQSTLSKDIINEESNGSDPMVSAEEAVGEEVTSSEEYVDAMMEID